MTLKNIPDVLLIEDDQRLADLTQRYLEQNDLSVEVIHRGDEGIEAFRRLHPKLLLLDLNLPGKDGLEICREVRKTYTGPIIMLTAKDTNIDEVIGLEAGADDYVTKPADPMVLLARIRALLRRSEAKDPDPVGASDDIEIDQFKISPSSQKVWLENQEISFSTQEFDLLHILAKNAGTILSRENLFKMTRGIDYDGLDRSIDVRISKLRKKLKDDGPEPLRIKTVWGKGYLFVPDAWK